MEQVQLGAELSPNEPVSAAERVQRFLEQGLAAHEQTLNAAQEAVGHAVGQLSRGEKRKFWSAVKTLFKDVLKPEAESILGEINEGHLQLRHPNKEQRAALTSKLYNVLNAAHLLVSILMMSGTKVCCQHVRAVEASRHLRTVLLCSFKVSKVVITQYRIPSAAGGHSRRVIPTDSLGGAANIVRAVAPHDNGVLLQAVHSSAQSKVGFGSQRFVRKALLG